MTDPMDDLRQASADVSGVELTNHSPATQAVLDNYGRALFTKQYAESGRIEIAVAAALRAAADQAENVCPARPSTEWGEGWLEGVKDVVAGFRRIASELEVQ